MMVYLWMLFLMLSTYHHYFLFIKKKKKSITCVCGSIPIILFEDLVHSILNNLLQDCGTFRQWRLLLRLHEWYIWWYCMNLYKYGLCLVIDLAENSGVYFCWISVHLHFKYTILTRNSSCWCVFLLCLD